MKIIVTESKKEKMSEYAEKMLKYGGKLMQCIEELGSNDMGERWEDEDMDERGSMGNRGSMGGRGDMGNRGGGFGNRYGNRWVDDEEDMGERRRRSNGRYY